MECRPSWAPPISMHTLSSAVQSLAISCRAHCLLRLIDRLWGWRAKPSFRSTLTRQIRRQTARHATHGRRHKYKYPDREAGRLGMPGEPCSHRAVPEQSLNKDGKIFCSQSCADGLDRNNKSCSRYGDSQLFAAAALMQGDHCYIVDDIGIN